MTALVLACAVAVASASVLRGSMESTADAAAPLPPCCQGPCTSPEEKYYSVDRIFNMCGESCMNPKDYWLYKIFEPGLTKAQTNFPCSHQRSKVSGDGNFTVYYQTEVHGFRYLNMTVDMYKPAKV